MICTNIHQLYVLLATAVINLQPDLRIYSNILYLISIIVMYCKALEWNRIQIDTIIGISRYAVTHVHCALRTYICMRMRLVGIFQEYVDCLRFEPVRFLIKFSRLSSAVNFKVSTNYFHFHMTYSPLCRPIHSNCFIGF